ncbi:tRNA (adenosine(37)-N6)-threonylcarbamoyltransferase complex ATPase subunit type 1 TsaE [uncultured Levyella sp.]|uniref:tRNA (adenosine(37)-N6)-threonylcarbamoyltransferase complex ATPase subunit type 1 TsaE n=1 Tax=uncultured Levyella sp. TaxID=1715800 RepID=UPI0025895E79|nr:tRNA (adenosine(37)-N6)-threonylcarbamoyltransferase complex ATPase subunit type 1 TsaE [uncultured Levyella sp.]
MRIETKEAMRKWAETFADSLQLGDVVSLEGTLGAGKTQIVTWIAAYLGADRPAGSPTFSLVNHYPTPKGDVFHLDLYRLEKPEDIEAIDYETYFYPEEAMTFVEWADKAGDYLPHGLRHVRLTPLGGEAREVEVWQD